MWGPSTMDPQTIAPPERRGERFAGGARSGRSDGTVRADARTLVDPAGGTAGRRAGEEDLLDEERWLLIEEPAGLLLTEVDEAAVRLRPLPLEGSNKLPGLQAKRNVADNQVNVADNQVVEGGVSRTWDRLGSSQPRVMSIWMPS